MASGCHLWTMENTRVRFSENWNNCTVSRGTTEDRYLFRPTRPPYHPSSTTAFFHSTPNISLTVQLIHPFYTFSWEQRKFEEIAVRSSVICSDDTLPRVEYEDIVSGTGRLNKDIYAKQSSKSGIVFHQGDVLYGKLRPYLQNWLLPTFDGLAVGDFWVLQPQNADSSFLYRLIQSRQFDEVANQSTGTKMPRADWKLVSKTVFSIPSNISEQAAIGTYFTALDSLITLHQRQTIVYAVIRSIRKVILAERQYFAPPMVRKSPWSLSVNSLLYCSKSINAIVMRASGKGDVLWRRIAP